MAHTLTDDGTFDTVIRCDECGHETRFNFDNDHDDSDDSDVIGENFERRTAYDAFVADCIVQLDDEGCEECHTEDD